MFMGEYVHSLDEKSRLTIPVKFRKQLGNKFVVTRWMEKSLFSFTENGWQKFEKKLNRLPFGTKDVRAFRRFILAGAIETNFDNQGRILIPPVLKEHAQLKKEVVITGAGNGFEMWSKRNWQIYSAGTAKKFDDIAEKLVSFDL